MEHSSTPVRTYFLVYISLLFLMVITVVVSEYHLGGWGILVAFTIAGIKAVMVLLYFMHLRYSSKLTWLFAGAGFVWLLILIGLMMTDYISRGWVGQ